jgi:hypothetical protein
MKLNVFNANNFLLAIATLLAFSSLKAQDIPHAISNLQTTPAGSLVMAMENMNHSSDPLTATMGEFNATKRVDGAAQLRWTSLTEKDNLVYFIEHSTDGSNYTTVGEVAGRGDSKTGFTYDFLHDEMERGVNYYRIRMVALGGKQAYSETRKLMVNHKLHVLHVFPNPAIGTANLILDAKDGENIIVSVTDVTGHELKKQQLVVKEHTARLDLNDFSRGMYSIVISLNSGEQVRGKLLVAF